MLNALAASHFYLGAGLGAGIQYFEPNFELFSIPDAKHASLGGRIFAGYQLNERWSLEAGYTNIGNYQNDGASNQFVCVSSNLQECIANYFPLNQYFNENLGVTNNVKAEMFDLGVKWRWPLTANFSLFVKGGVAYIDATIDSQVNIDLNFFPGTPHAFTVPICQHAYASNHGSFLQQLNPMAAIGDEYQLSQRLALRFEYDYYFPVKMHSTIASDEGTLIPSIILGELVYSF